MQKNFLFAAYFWNNLTILKVFSLISRMKNNRELLKKRRENYKQRLEDMNVSYGKKQSHRKATSEEITAIRQKMKQQNARERRRMIYVFVIALVLTALLIYGLIVALSNLTFPV